MIRTSPVCTKVQEELRALCGVLQSSTVLLPVDVIVESDVVAAVIVVRLLRLYLTVSSSHHDVALVQKHLTHSLLYTNGSQRLGHNMQEDGT